MKQKKPLIEILAIGQSRHPLTIDDVILLYWKRDVSRFHEKNPHLSVDEIHSLESEIQQMLVQSTVLQQLKRVQQQMETIGNNPDSIELHEQLIQLEALAEATHAYDIEKHPEYLVLEYYADIMLRPEQVKNLDLLQIKEGKIHNKEFLGTALEMIMGGGKTTILIPLLAILNADGENLSIGVLPSALLPSMSQMLAERLGTSFKQSVEILEINRNSLIDQQLLDRLKEMKNNQKLFLTTDSSLKNLFLNYIEFLNLYTHVSSEARLELEFNREIFVEIFTLLKNHSSVVVDEVDQILNPRTEKHFTLGTPSSLPVEEIDLISISL